MFAGFEGIVNNKCARGDGIVDAFGSDDLNRKLFGREDIESTLRWKNESLIFLRNYFLENLSLMVYI